MTIDIGFTVTIPPILNPGHVDETVTDWAADVTDSVARQGLSHVHLLMDRAFRNPTPYYETQVTVDRAGEDRVVHDRGVIYGPWLEGVGSRNATTRFKGYAHWRRTTQWLAEEETPRVIDRHLPDLYTRLGASQ